MSLEITLSIVGVVGLVVGILGGIAIARWDKQGLAKALLAEIAPNLKTELSADEAAVLALFRKATGKAPATLVVQPPAAAAPAAPAAQ